MPYDHIQAGNFILAALGIPAFLCAAVLVAALASGQASPGIPIAGSVLVILLACLALFHRLRVVVSDGAVTASFGFGWPRRRFLLSEVRSARAVRNRWLYGWGIRLTPSGWMYNIAGLDAVELTLANGSRFRIGTDDPKGLVAALGAGS